MRTLTAFDVDTDALADTFERMADGLRSNDVLVDRLEAGHVAPGEYESEFRFDMEFKATHGFVDVTDPIEYDATHYLRFADEYAETLLSGRKNGTLRVGFERDFETGDVVDLIDEDGTKFAEATVDAVIESSVGDVVRMGFAAWGAPDAAPDSPSDTVDFVVDRLRRHYSDSVDADTVVTGIRLRDVTGVDE